MRKVLFPAILFCATAWSRGAEIILTSPDHAQTFAYGEMISHQLSVDPNNDLVARITFSNLSFAGDTESRVDEPFDFRFQGTQADRATRTVLVRDRQGKQRIVARFRGDPTNGWVHLTPEAKIYLIKKSGRITAVLTATSEPRPGLRWIQMDNNCSLQNLLAGLWCKGG